VRIILLSCLYFIYLVPKVLCLPSWTYLFLYAERWNCCFLEITSSETAGDEMSESFAFALVNGALGVFEVHGRRIRDFRYFVLLTISIQLLCYETRSVN